MKEAVKKEASSVFLLFSSSQLLLLAFAGTPFVLIAPFFPPRGYQYVRGNHPLFFLLGERFPLLPGNKNPNIREQNVGTAKKMSNFSSNAGFTFPRKPSGRTKGNTYHCYSESPYKCDDVEAVFFSFPFLAFPYSFFKIMKIYLCTNVVHVVHVAFV